MIVLVLRLLLGEDGAYGAPEVYAQDEPTPLAVIPGLEIHWPAVAELGAGAGAGNPPSGVKGPPQQG